MNEPIFEVWRAVNEAAMAEDVSLIRRLVADAGIQPGVHVGRDPSEFTPVITAEWALGQWAEPSRKTLPEPRVLTEPELIAREIGA